jgi:hypothetical protein
MKLHVYMNDRKNNFYIYLTENKISASQYDKHNTIAFYSHKESTCMTTSFHQKVSFWPLKLVQPSTFH